MEFNVPIDINVGSDSVVSNTGSIIFAQGGSVSLSDTALFEIVEGGIARAEDCCEMTFDLAGSSSLVNAGTFDLSPNSSILVHSGSLQNSGSLNTGRLTIQQGGTVSGGSTITANVINRGRLAPGFSPGHLTIDGDYTQSTDGVLELEIAGVIPREDHDRLSVSGQASLDGALRLELINGFVPDEAAQFDVFYFGSVAGDFATRETTDPGRTRAFDVQLETNRLDVGAIIRIDVFASVDNGKFDNQRKHCRRITAA